MKRIRHEESRAASLAPPTPGAWPLRAAMLLLSAWTILAFLPALDNGYNYDDDANIVANMHYRGLAPSNLKWMFTTFHMGHYQPLSWLTLAVDYRIWGDRPFGYHLTNVLLHAAAAVVALAVLLGLIRAAGRDHSGPSARPAMVLAAFIGALLFAVHPLRVESVAWVTERRDVLSSLLLLITVLLYLRAQEQAAGRARNTTLAIALVVYVASLLSRAMGVTLPVLLVLIDVYPLRRIDLRRPLTAVGRRAWLEKLLFVIPAVVFAAIAPLAQRSVGAEMDYEVHNFVQRVAQSCYGLLFYLWKTLAPLSLVPLYELREPLAVTAPKYVLSAIGVLAVAAMVGWLGRRRPALVVAALCYVVLLLPVLGLAQAGRQEVADRYSYLPAIVISALLAGGIVALWGRAGPGGRAALVGVPLIAAVALSALTWRQCLVWRDPVSLWSHAVASGPPSPIAHYNYASSLARTGRPAEAIKQFEATLRLSPRHKGAHYNLANALFESGRYDEAIATYRQALVFEPNNARIHMHLGDALNARGDCAGAIAALQRAVGLDAALEAARVGLGRAHNDLAARLAADGDDAGAERELRAGLLADARNADIHYNLGNLLRRRNERSAAIAEYQEAVRLRGDFAAARVNLGIVLSEAGRPAEAEAEYRAALRAAPRSYEARYNLAALLASANRVDEAIAELEIVQQLEPGNARVRELLEQLRARPR